MAAVKPRHPVEMVVLAAVVAQVVQAGLPVLEQQGKVTTARLAIQTAHFRAAVAAVLLKQETQTEQAMGATEQRLLFLAHL